MNRDAPAPLAKLRRSRIRDWWFAYRPPSVEANIATDLGEYRQPVCFLGWVQFRYADYVEFDRARRTSWFRLAPCQYLHNARRCRTREYGPWPHLDEHREVDIVGSCNTIPFTWLMPEARRDQTEWALSALTLVGGGTYGMGAAINGGCAFSTLNQLADGKLRMLGALLGFCLGVVIVVAFGRSGRLPLPSPIQLESVSRFLLSLAVAVGLAFWCVYEVRRLWISRPRGVKFTNLLLLERYRLSTAAALMGISNAMLYLVYGSWSYTGTLQQGIESLFSIGDRPRSIRWILFAAMLGGMILSTLQRRSFHLAWRPSLAWLRNFGGGTLMGIGAVMIPGGNDTLVLHGIPSNSPNAFPAYIAMLAGIAATLVTMRFLINMEIKVECGGDVCVIEDPHNQ